MTADEYKCATGLDLHYDDKDDRHYCADWETECPKDWTSCTKCARYDDWLSEPIIEDGVYREDDYFKSLTYCMECKPGHVSVAGLCFDP